MTTSLTLADASGIEGPTDFSLPQLLSCYNIFAVTIRSLLFAISNLIISSHSARLHRLRCKPAIATLLQTLTSHDIPVSPEQRMGFEASRQVVSESRGTIVVVVVNRTDFMTV